MSLVFFDNPILYTFFNGCFKEFDCVLVENLNDINTIKNFKNIDFEKYKSAGIVYDNKGIIESDNITSTLKSTLNINSLWIEDFSETIKMLIPPSSPNKKIENDNKKSLSEKLEDKKHQANEINLLNEHNNKVNINISLK